MEQHVVNGLVLVRRQPNGSRILLVRTAPATAWELPVCVNGEGVAELLDVLKRELLPTANFIPVEDETRIQNGSNGRINFHLVGADADLPPYFESDRFIDARWAGFEEAWHIVRGDLGAVLRWSKRSLHKVPLVPAAA